MKKIKVQNVPKIVPLTLSVAIISVMMCLTIMAWNPPGQTPPGGNVAAPLNTGGGAQGKLGNLGIGTTNPGIAKTYIYNNGTSVGLYVGNGTPFGQAYIEQDGPVGTHIWLAENGTNVFNVASGGNTFFAGNVGIGTTNPTEKLELSSGSNIKFTDNGVIKSMDNNHALLFRRSENKIELREFGDIIFSPGATAGTETAKMVIKSDGNVGIGTNSPEGTLSVARGTANGGTAVFAGTDNKSHFNYSVNEDTYIRGGKANSKVIISDNSGNVGVGLVDPTQKLDVNGYVKSRSGLCIGNDCCTSWTECVGRAGDPFMPVSGCTSNLPAGNKKIFVTSLTYNVELVHTPNFTYTMANADNACQARASAAGLSGTYLALMYETVLSELNNCNKITVLRYPTDILPAAALWNGQKIDGTNCQWHLVALNGSDMFSVDPDGNYLKNPIKYNEFGTLTDARVFTNFQPTGAGGYDRMNTCLQNSTCNYITGGATRGCFYGYSTSKDANWAGAYSPLNGMGLCATPCMDASSQKALYCVQQ